MKIIDLLAKRYGTDKLMHCEGGAAITALGLPFGIIGTVIAFILMVIVSIIKEMKFDTFFDWTDIYWAIYGGFAVVAYSIIIFYLIL